MGIPKRLTLFLEERNIPFRTESHPEAFTAQQAAQASHVPGRKFAKPVIVDADGKIWMAVMPATERVDLRRVQNCLGARKVRLACESEFAPLFADCDIGAMPILGSLYGIPVIASPELLESEEVAFTAGTHREIVRMKSSDWLEAEHPRMFEREAIPA